MTIMLVALAASAATFVGGSVALKLKDKLHLVLGFSAGAIIAVAFFDLIPEALELGEGMYSPFALMTATAVGFFAYVIVDRFILTHKHTDEDEHAHARANASAGALSGHSVLDGFAIGLAFQASPAIGAIVAAAVLTHDFSDGINTVNLVLKNGGTRMQAMRWLIVDALAPLVGAFATLFTTLPSSLLALVLATFAGFFLYIGASDLLPESHHAHPKTLTTLLTLVGAVVLFIAIRIAG